MENKTTLDEINSEGRVNEIISRDEESLPDNTSTALKMAEELILQLPEEHEGRRTWLTRFGQSTQARSFNDQTKS